MNMQERLAQRCNELEKRIAALETLEATMAHIFGWDGSAWRKLAMVWGFSDRWVEEITTTTGAAGIRRLSFTACSTGEVWVLLAVNGRNQNTDPTDIQVIIFAGGIAVQLNVVATPGVNVRAIWSGHQVLKKDDYVQIRFSGCALDDDVTGEVLGYKMETAA